MESIFVLNKTNFDFFKSEPSVENCKKLTDSYWIIYDRVCYHYGESEYVIHNNVVHTDKHLYDGYLHVEKGKKPLYAVSHYTVGQLKDISARLLLPMGTKSEMYNVIRVILDEIYLKIKKN
jgi:hypothetical protein